MRILLIGKNGQVGHELQHALPSLGDVIAIGRDACDLTNLESLRDLVRQHRPDVIVNAAAYTAVDRAEAERELAIRVNAEAPRIVAEEATKLNALLVHYSTDYVFDGMKEGAYTEADDPNPLNVYGESKLMGERAIKASCPHALILRTSWVFGRHGQNFIKTILRLARERDEVRVVSDQFGTPTSAEFLADVTASAIAQRTKFLADPARCGVYHAVPKGETNWFEFALHVMQRMKALHQTETPYRAKILSILADDYGAAAVRPKNSRLDARRLYTTLDLKPDDWQSYVDRVLIQSEDVIRAA